MTLSWTFVFDSLSTMILVFMRMSGMIFLNPLFSRRNVPGPAKVTLALALTILISPGLTAANLSNMTEWDFIPAMMRELFAGFCCSYVFQLFYYLLFFAGDFMDIQFGLSMARVFDPGTSIQSSVSGTLLNLIFILYLFVTDSHLLMLRIFSTSYMIVPLGAPGIELTQLAGFMTNLFLSAFILIVKLTLPFVAAEFIVELSMGVLMKLIPQIHVFVINIQIKVLLSIFLLIVFASPISSFMDNYLQLLFQNMEQALYVLTGAG